MNKPIWERGSLTKILRENFQDYVLVIVSNREPYLHCYDEKGRIKIERSIGGVAIALDTIMKKTEGVWVAYGGSEADKAVVDENDHIQVPPRKPRYTLRRIWMREWERQRYYDGFSNETLWPLCHVVFEKPTFVENDWRVYRAINRRFAKVVLNEIRGKKALVWIQDYHLALVSQYIREKRPDVLIGQFWHIPWPTYEVFRICPWKQEILAGLLHNDVIGFHHYRHVNNFLNNVSWEMEAKVVYEDLIVGYHGRKIKVGAFPISVDYQEISKKAKSYTKDNKIVRRYIKGGYKILSLGVDRLDYTKGIPNRLLAIERFLDKNPQYREIFVHLAIVAPSRTNLQNYQDLKREVELSANRINQKFQTESWRPIYLVNKVIRREDVLRLSKFSDLCLVTPLDDGMNLVAKEYVSANRGDGALILSNYIGAAKELSKAFLVNPYDVEGISDVIKEAIECSVEEKRERMKQMKRVLEERNIFRWAGKFLLELANRKEDRSLAGCYLPSRRLQP